MGVPCFSGRGFRFLFGMLTLGGLAGDLSHDLRLAEAQATNRHLRRNLAILAQWRVVLVGVEIAILAFWRLHVPASSR